MGGRRASSSASWLSEGSQRGQGQCFVDFWCWIREGMVVVVGCDINVVVRGYIQCGRKWMKEGKRLSEGSEDIQDKVWPDCGASGICVCHWRVSYLVLHKVYDKEISMADGRVEALSN